MNPAEETNLRAEVVVMREMIKCLIAQLSDETDVTAMLEAAAKQIVEAAPPFTQERLALQRAIKHIDPLGIKRRPAMTIIDDD
jgi:hypothetical protein